MADVSVSNAAPTTEASVEAIETGNDTTTNTAEKPLLKDKLPLQDPQAPQDESTQEQEASETPLQGVNGSAAGLNETLATSDQNGPVSDLSEAKPTEEKTPSGPKASKNPVTPSKKASNGSAKKRSSGVPEHRSRKASKKKTKPALHLDAKPGALFLARMKGHQPWPSIICDEDMLPAILIQTRPVTAAQADGSFKKEDYAEGGRREHERTFPVMFLFTNEFAWIPNTELTTITPEECAEAVGKQKSKTLAGAYNIASERHDLDHFKQVLLEHQEMLNAEADAKAEREAKKAEKSSKQKRKSDVAASSADDKMDIDEDGKGKTKKRKKEAGADEDEKPAKTQKTGPTKLKLNMTPKTPGSDSSKKKTPKSKSTSKKPNAKGAGSEDEVAPKPQEEVLSPTQLREKKEKEVRYIRHKLQKGFLSRDTVPGEDEIETMSNYLSKVEAHPDLEGSILRATKIHKVLKAMIRLDSIPKDDEYHFKKRSRELLDKWNKTLASDPSAAAEKEDDTKVDSTGVKKGEADEPANAMSSDEKIADKTAGESAATTQVPTQKGDAHEHESKENGDGDIVGNHVGQSNAAKEPEPEGPKDDTPQTEKAPDTHPAEPDDLEVKS